MGAVDATIDDIKNKASSDQNGGLLLALALIRGLDEKIGILISTQKEGVKIAMDASDRAIVKSEAAYDRRFEGLNELRKMAEDWRSEFARQSVVNLEIRALTDKIDVLMGRVGSIEAGASNIQGRLWAVSAVWAVVMVVVTVGSRFIGH